MRNFSLATRLFLSCLLVSALLFGGIYFYVKGFTETRGLEQSRLSFDRAERLLHGLLRARGTTTTNLPGELESASGAEIARSELDASGLTFVLLRNGRPLHSGLPLTAADERLFPGPFPDATSLLTLSSGRYLARPLRGRPDFLLLYPLFELDRSSRELLGAFLVAGAALLVLTMILAQILAREISRPLILLRNRVRAMAEKIGLTPPPVQGDETTEIAASYLEFAQHLQTAFEHKKLALEELEAYKAELLRVNLSLHRRLFQVRVLLSLWRERDQALDVKDFLSRFLEALLPGLPFEFGGVIIRPLAEMRSEIIFARKLGAADARDESLEPAEKGATHWTEILDPAVREFLLRESSACMESQSIRLSSVRGSLRTGAAPGMLTVLSFRLQQGSDPLGSVHFLTEHASPPIPASLNEFLLSLSAQVSAQLQIQALSFTTRLDPLTRLYNRGYLTDRLREEVVRGSRKREPFSLALLDIDHFQAVNEEHGQQAADEILRGVASMLKSSCRGSDAVCRLTGSVLAIVLADTPSPGAKIFAENIRRAVAGHEFPTPRGSLRITVSLGIAEFPTDGDGVEALLARAEEALRDAKEAGRNTWRAAA